MKRIATLIIGMSLPMAAIAVGVSPAMAQQITTLDPATLVPAIGVTQTGADIEVASTLPKDLATVVDLSTVHVLAEDATGRYSTAMDVTGQKVCVISQMTDAQGFIGTSCSRKEKFARGGLSVGLQGPAVGNSVKVVYLLPGDVDAGELKARSSAASSALKGSGVSQVIVQTGNDNLPDQLDLPRSNSGVKFGFKKLHVAGR